MPVAIARILAHAVHGFAFLLLVVTALLLTFPELRAEVTGGYALTLASLHRWIGVAFVALPAALLLSAGARRCLAPAEDGGPGHLRLVHTALVVALSAVFLLSGLALWARASVSSGVFDAARAVHLAAMWIALAALAAHLGEVGWRRVSLALRATGAEAQRSVARPRRGG